MIVIRNIPTKLPAACMATIGFFDGVHNGHKFLIEQVKKEAASRGICSAVITFPLQPRQVMNTGDIPELLTTYEEKIELLADTGIDYCFVIDFTMQIANLSAYDFMQTIRERYNVAGLIIGHDHRFGHNRSEGFDDYCRYGELLGIYIVHARAYHFDEITISSSAIREFLWKNKIKEANSLLGYPYFLRGKVVDGHKVGRTLGFPTANILPDDEKIIPGDGVYAVRVVVGDAAYKGMLSIGTRPTIDNGKDRSIEVHILHFHTDIYNSDICISFVEFMRPEIKFASREALVSQMNEDAERTEALL